MKAANTKVYLSILKKLFPYEEMEHDGTISGWYYVTKKNGDIQCRFCGKTVSDADFYPEMIDSLCPAQIVFREKIIPGED